MNISLSNIVSASEIQRNYRKVFNRAKRIKEPLVVMRGNDPEIALIDLKTLEEIQQKLAESELKEALKAIRIAKREATLGKLKKLSSGGLVELAS